jgi:serine/threonine-protein phosphatase 2A regulatory subunit B'
LRSRSTPTKDYEKAQYGGNGLGYSKNDLLKNIPLLTDASVTNKSALLIQKLKLCSILFEWTEDASVSQKDNQAKEVKRQQLLELVEFMGSVYGSTKNKHLFTELVLAEILAMISANIFRTLPLVAISAGGEEDDEHVFEPSWPHLHIVYEFLLRCIVSDDIEAKLLKKHINGPFMVKLLALFDSFDQRERDYLKTIVHRIYAKFMSLRTFIRKAINHDFFVFIYETEKHNGIAELLEILGSIINGFALPLKAEHKTFLVKVLMPMHKVRVLASFHQQLAYCVTQFVDKDPTLSALAIASLLRYWPVTNSAKEVLFLNELEELLEMTSPSDFQKVFSQLCRRVAKTISSAHFQVAERALSLWHNESISSLLVEHSELVLPLIFPALRQSQGHWNHTVSNLAKNVLEIFSEHDPALCEECALRYPNARAAEEDRKALIAEQWKRI